MSVFWMELSPRRSACLLLGCCALTACTAAPQPRPESSPTPAAPAEQRALTDSAGDAPHVAAGTEGDAGEPPSGPCDVMRRAGESSETALGVAHLENPALEGAIRRFYVRHVLGRGVDNRSLVEHPLIFDQVVTANGEPVKACVEAWRAIDPAGLLFGGTGYYLPRHNYVEVNFEFIDALDGMNAYTVFVDVATLEVVAAFRYANTQP
jgi:hypothetical protein